MPIKHLPSIFGMRPLDINRVFHELDAFAPLVSQRKHLEIAFGCLTQKPLWWPYHKANGQRKW